MEVRPEHLATALRALPILGFAGCNLTIPHKRSALALVDRLDPIAARVGAVNTVVVAADGSLEGRNTDGFGFIENLRAARTSWTARRGPAVIIGAGARRARSSSRCSTTAPRRFAWSIGPMRGRRRCPPSSAQGSSRSIGAGAATLWRGSPCWSTRRAKACMAKRARPDARSPAVPRRRQRHRLCAARDARSSPRRGRAAIRWSTGSACCCIRHGRALPLGSACARGGAGAA